MLRQTKSSKSPVKSISQNPFIDEKLSTKPKRKVRHYFRNKAIVMYFVAGCILVGLSWKSLKIFELERNHIFIRSSVSKVSQVSYKLSRKIKFKDLFDSGYKCMDDKDSGPRKETSPHFSKKGVMDFQVQLNTSKYILVVGDSVAIQLAQALQEAAGATNNENSRRVLHYSWRTHEGVTLGTTPSGGAVAGFRITGLFARKQRDNHFQLPPVPGGGWMSEHVNSLREGLRNHSSAIGNVSNMKEPKDNFDVVVHQWPFGWMGWNNKHIPAETFFTQESIAEAVNATYDVFGADTLILQTVPMMNNVENMKKQMSKVNSEIYNFAHSYVPPEDGTGVRNVLVMDVAWLSLNLFAYNSVGLQVTHESALNILQKRSVHNIHDYQTSAELIMDELNPLLSSRHDCCHPTVKEVVSYACAELVEYDQKKCQRNVYSYDGQHWCMSTMAGRMNGIIGCLMRCADLSSKSQRGCEMRCNDVYMSLNAIEFGDSEELINH